MDESKTINITDTVEWQSAKDLEGHIVIFDGGSLTIKCTVYLPKDAKIIIHPRAKLLLDGAVIGNACGDEWLGIERWSDKKSTRVMVLKNGAIIENLKYEILIE